MVCSVVVGGMDHEQGETSDGRSAESEDRRGGLRQQGGGSGSTISCGSQPL